MAVSTLGFTEASDPQDAAEYMWGEDMAALEIEQDDYERLRTEAAQKLRQSARELFGEAAGQSSPSERDRLLKEAAQKLHLANDPLPQQRRAVEALEQAVMRSCGRQAVLVRPSLPGHREVYHSDENCGLISGEGRHLERAGWALIGDAEAAGYRPCSSKTCRGNA